MAEIKQKCHLGRLVLGSAGTLLVLVGIGIGVGMPLYYQQRGQQSEVLLRELTAKVLALEGVAPLLPPVPGTVGESSNSPARTGSADVPASGPELPQQLVRSTEGVIEVDTISQEEAQSAIPAPPPTTTEGGRLGFINPEGGLAGLETLIRREYEPGVPDWRPLGDGLLTIEAFDNNYTFNPVANRELGSLGSLPPATRILIPAINVNAPVAPLDLLRDEDGRLYYQRPKGSIGRIETAGNPGENSRGWYFGHIRDAGNADDAFELLPKVVDILAEGRTVNVILETADGPYLYQVAGRPVVLSAEQFDGGYFHQILYAAHPEVVLVTCYTAWKPTHRLLITATLVGVPVR